MPWYCGPTLVEAIDLLPQPFRRLSDPLRLTVQRVYHIKGVGDIGEGKIITGKLQTGMRLLFAPERQGATVSCIRKDEKDVTEAEAGNIVTFKLVDTCIFLHRGSIAGDIYNRPPRSVVTFSAKVAQRYLFVYMCR